MDSELTSLAGNAGTTLVTLMLSDAWQQVRDGIVRIWRRTHPEQAEGLTAELTASREGAVAARAAGDRDALDDLGRRWQARLHHLSDARPDVVEQVRAVFAEAGRVPTGRPPRVTQRASASGHGRIYQAGRDQYVTDSDRPGE